MDQISKSEALRRQIIDLGTEISKLEKEHRGAMADFVEAVTELGAIIPEEEARELAKKALYGQS